MPVHRFVLLALAMIVAALGLAVTPGGHATSTARIDVAMPSVLAIMVDAKDLPAQSFDGY